MAKRRRQRKFLKLSSLQEVCLIFGSNPDLAFEGDLQARAAWFRHREQVLSQFNLNHPGMRPWAFWRFEWRGPERTGRDDWVLLVEAGEVGEEEAALLLAQWLKLLELRQGFVRSTYDQHKKGWLQTNNPAWPELVEMYDRQAALLGEVAVRTWQDVKAEIISRWENDGCGGCAYALDGNYCDRRECKHWRSSKTKKGEISR